MNRAHSVSQAPLLSQNALLGYCDEVLKSLMRQSLLFSHVLQEGEVGGGGHRKNINIQTTDHLMPANPGQQRSYCATLDYEIRTWSAAWLST